MKALTTFLSPFVSSPKTTTSTSVVTIKPPPPEFDFRTEISISSRTAVSNSHPQLMDLVDNGTLILIPKNLFGPVPIWRTEFVEPEEIWLVGTSHLSQQSAADVERVVRAVKPDNVVVELCRSRAGIMYTSTSNDGDGELKSNMFSLSGAGFFGAVGRSLNLGEFTSIGIQRLKRRGQHLLQQALTFLATTDKSPLVRVFHGIHKRHASSCPPTSASSSGGQTALALRLLLAVFSSKISSDTDRPFGDEFRAARKASEEIGAQLVLGDRPVEITLERAWNSLEWSEKLGLVVSVFRGITAPALDISRDQLKDQQMDESPFQLYEKLSLSYPSLLQPLIHERDTYLAWSLKRSKAVNNCKRVVGVIGKGHLNGVIYALISDLGDLRFRDLCGERSSSGGSNRWVDTLLKDLVRDTVIGILLWGLYEQLQAGL